MADWLCQRVRRQSRNASEDPEEETGVEASAQCAFDETVLPDQHREEPA